ncbi:sulfite reductase [Cladophialophora carrionii]|uniref:Sulfite reductase n=1 Tax=Cladophialophora carrionii TaxID=86049 RepID=A0A1C1CSN8_9EURO|nr:sulfite reductase [Cladophialophora carrionii]
MEASHDCRFPQAEQPDEESTYSQYVDFRTAASSEHSGSELNALEAIDPAGFFIRHPPKPHELEAELTDETQLFQTIHMGAAVVDEKRWRLVMDGLVEQPFTISFEQLKSMPRTTITAFHECYGSPITPPIHALWRIGNVKWTGVRLSDLLKLARPNPRARFIWSQGLDAGSFAGVSAHSYEKDLPLEKAQRPEVLIAYEMNGERLNKKRGGPDRRAPGPFTTTFYNEVDPTDPTGQSMRPVWMVEPNSMIVGPEPGAILQGPQIEISGRAWGCQEIEGVDISIDGGETWLPRPVVDLRPRREFEWQLFRAKLSLPEPGKYKLVARARDTSGLSQPLAGRRNHVHTVEVEVLW